MENYKEFTEELPEVITELRKPAEYKGYKINTQNYIVLVVYISNKQLETENV